MAFALGGRWPGTGWGSILLALVWLAGCATGRIVDEGFIDAAGGFRVRLPEAGWDVIEIAGANVALARHGTSARIAVGASCPASETGPLPILARHLLFGLRQVQTVGRRALVLDGTEAIETIVRGDLNGHPVQVRAVVARQGGCLYDLLAVAAPAEFAEAERALADLMDSWQFTKRSP
ncbi:MAG: hypothetical protein ACE5HK_02915 [Candidatus Methylomirabilales bacterium]